jgi:hypothetical protein
MNRRSVLAGEYAVGGCIAVGAAFGLLFGSMLGDSAVGVVAGVAAGVVVGAIVQGQRSGPKPEKPGA